MGAARAGGERARRSRRSGAPGGVLRTLAARSPSAPSARCHRHHGHGADRARREPHLRHGVRSTDREQVLDGPSSSRSAPARWPPSPSSTLGSGGHAGAGPPAGGISQTVWSILRWPLGVALLIVSVGLILNWAPRRHQPAWSWMSFAAVVTVALLVVVTVLLNVFFGLSGTFGRHLRPAGRDHRPRLLDLCDLRRAAVRRRPRGATGGGPLRRGRADAAWPRSPHHSHDRHASRAASASRERSE